MGTGEVARLVGVTPSCVSKWKRVLHRRGRRAEGLGRAAPPPRISVERLPPYAPDLNPAEQLWNNGKRTDVANLAPTEPGTSADEPLMSADEPGASPDDAGDLRGRVSRSLIRRRCSPDLPASAFDHAGLPL
jgi:hypothetical protein